MGLQVFFFKLTMIILPAVYASSSLTSLAPYQKARAYTAKMIKNVAAIPKPLIIAFLMPKALASSKLALYLSEEDLRKKTFPVLHNLHRLHSYNFLKKGKKSFS